MPESADVFALPRSRAAKMDPDLIDRDRSHFAEITASLSAQIEHLTDFRAALRRTAGRSGQQALERDLEIHRVTSRIRLLHRYRSDMVLGHFLAEGSAEPTYIGRTGIAGPDGAPLVIDWRAPAAEPFFAATHARPMGLAYRRRYRWSNGVIVDYWDEVFTGADGDHTRALDDQSAFIASLGTARSSQMRDVLATIHSDQDAMIRADSSGPLVIDGGPGTGKTVVALHRAAYLLYADPRLGPGRGGVLIVGPNRPYLHYVADVLPSLGEEDVQVCTLPDLLPEGAGAPPEPDPQVAAIKGSAWMIGCTEPAASLYEEAPTTAVLVETPWQDVVLAPADWARAFHSLEPGTPHNEAHEQIWESLIDTVAERIGGEIQVEQIARSVTRNRALRRELHRAWPILDPEDLVADLWAVPAYLRMCAPGLSPDERALLRRPEGSPWTLADLPLLDAMRARLGDASLATATKDHDVETAQRHDYMDDVVSALIAADDDGEGLVTSLVQPDLRDVLDDDGRGPRINRNPLDGPFSHIVVDEAQELTDAEWSMILRRCPSRSLTLVGDRAQARRPFTETWVQRLERAGLPEPRVSTLTINYRTPREVMDEAEQIIRAVVPDANVPTSIRSTGVPVRHEPLAALETVIEAWSSENDEGVACVIGVPDYAGNDRVRSLFAPEVKGLEFDLVVLAPGSDSGVDRYVAMTRATQELVILEN